MKRIASLVLVSALAATACDTPSPTQDSLRMPVATSVAADNTLLGDAQAGVSVVFPSTNEINYANGWAHVLWVDLPDVPPEQVTLEFVQPRGFFACFEYRIDDEAPTSTANGGNNYNPGITDGLWNFTCPGGASGMTSVEKTFQATSHVDIRMGFGAESDERFDWTRFYVLSLQNKDQCKGGAWEAMGFKNQGQCVRYVETGKDSRNGT